MIVVLALVLLGGGTRADPPADDADAALARDIRATMDAAVDPCADFYQFACGGWLASSSASIDASKSKVAKSFTVTADTNQAILFGLICQNQTDERVRLLVESCMDLDAIEQHGLDSASLASYLSDAELVQTLDDVMRVAGRLRRINGPFVIASDVVVDSLDPKRYIISVQPGGLILKNENIYSNARSAKLVAYRNHVRDMLQVFGDDDAEQSSANIVAFERELFFAKKADRNETARSNISSIETQATLAEFARSTGVDWGEYFAGSGVATNAQTALAVKFASAIRNVTAVFSSQPIPTLSAYLKWALISVVSPYLPGRIRQADFDFFQTRLLGKQTPLIRWRYCTDIADTYLSELTGPAFAMATFSPEAKADATQILNNTMAAFAAQFRLLDWMDDDTMNRSGDKIASMQAMIGYPDAWNTSKYDDVDFADDPSFVQLMIGVKESQWRQSVDLLGQSVDRTAWTKPVTTVNAFYTPVNAVRVGIVPGLTLDAQTLNSITFPAGILQEPFFNERYPITMNFGGIGFIMTHELVHGFDEKGGRAPLRPYVSPVLIARVGRQYDKLGGLKQWWPDNVLQAYKNRVQCYRTQYSRMKDVDPIAGNITVNGNQTIGENIAVRGKRAGSPANPVFLTQLQDNGAVDVGLRAMQLYLESHPAPDPILDEFTLEQMYFLSVGQMFCTRMRPELARLLQATNPHPPARIRINAIMSNSNLFSAAYRCPAGSAMNPVQKCDLWRTKQQDDA